MPGSLGKKSNIPKKYAEKSPLRLDLLSLIVTLRQSLAGNTETQNQKYKALKKRITENINDHKKLNIVIKSFYQSPEDEENHEEAPKRGFCVNVPIANRGHGDHE